MNGLLRHCVATLAYRGGKAIRGAPPEFATFQAAPGTRTPAEILAHISDLFDWALELADGRQTWSNSPAVGWDESAARFFAALEAFDRRLASNEPIQCEPEKLLQAPIADALSHIGQIAMLRRIAGCPIRGENYFVAKIEAGRAGAAQPEPLVEFD
jgi:hypothetical protein